MTQPPNFISVDAALLAKQAEKLDALKKSVEDLVRAVDTRPTREELAEQARRNRLKRIATGVLLGLIGYGFFHQQQQYAELLTDYRTFSYNACTARNIENGKIIKLLTDLGARPQPGRQPDPEAQKIVSSFINSLKPVNCGTPPPGSDDKKD